MEVKFMRRLFAGTVSLVVLGLAIGLGAASAAVACTPGSGRLVGQTQISFGCPGPVGACDPWRAFPGARFTIRRAGPTGEPLPQIVRRVVSDAQAHFIVRLAAGRYVITPVAQLHTHGGSSLTVRVRPGGVTSILVRFQGYPQMA
jgi:hypothetical protein